MWNNFANLVGISTGNEAESEGHYLTDVLEKKGKQFTREVRSVFGWTNVPKDSNTPNSQNSHSFPHDQFDFLKRSLMAQQDLLPKLPVPPLEDTVKRYLKSLEPILSAEELAHSKQVAAHFLQGDGKELQEQLCKYDSEESSPSWLEKYWDDAYLCGRDPIAINVNYFFVLEDDPDPDKMNQAYRAAALLLGAMKFKKELDNDKLELDDERGVALCMSQYTRLFGHARIPGKSKDRLVCYSTQYKPTKRELGSTTSTYEGPDSSHIAVICRDHFWVFDCFDSEGEMLPHAALEAIFRDIAKLSANCERGPPVGIFTCIDRNTWYKMHTTLSSSPRNAAILDAINRAMFVICLDDCYPKNLDEISRLSCHGPGTNRWFDKHQLMVAANGKAGLVWEHAAGDGHTTLRLADEMYTYCLDLPHPETDSSDPISSSSSYIYVIGGAVPRRLEWDLTPAIEDEITAACETYKAAIFRNDTKTLRFTEFSGQFMKDSNLSPDAFVQIALQLAYYRMFGKLDAVYESASTKQFLHGRTETVRSVTSDSLAFFKVNNLPIFEKGVSKISTELKLLRQAIETHVTQMKAAKNGEGVDRHLFVLRMLAVAKKSADSSYSIPEFFTDPAYTYSGRWRLSSSHCGSAALSLFGFGPVVQNGLGVGYMIRKDSMNFNVTSNYPQTHLSQIYSTLLEQSLLTMKAIVLSHPDLLEVPSESLDFALSHPTTTVNFRYPELSPSSSPLVPPKKTRPSNIAEGHQMH